MKQCNSCGEIKSHLNFTKCATNPDGFQYKCKECEKAYRTGLIPEKVKSYKKQHYKDKELNIQCKDAIENFLS